MAVAPLGLGTAHSCCAVLATIGAAKEPVPSTPLANPDFTGSSITYRHDVRCRVGGISFGENFTISPDKSLSLLIYCCKEAYTREKYSLKDYEMADASGLIGKQVGSYRVVKELNSGPMAASIRVGT